MVERDTGAEGNETVRDGAAYEEACAVFGAAGAAAHVQALRSRLVKHLLRLGEGPVDAPTLSHMAHRIAGQAWSLGLPALAEASARLEEAATHRRDVAPAREHWKAQARLAIQSAPDAGTAAGGDG